MSKRFTVEIEANEIPALWMVDGNGATQVARLPRLLDEEFEGTIVVRLDRCWAVVSVEDDQKDPPARWRGDPGG